MAAIIGALRAVLSASIGQFQTDMGKAARAVEVFGARAAKVGKDIQKVGRQMSLALTLPVVAIGTAVVKTAADFEAGMNRVAAATQAPKKQVEEMARLARELGPAMGVGPSEVADAMEMLAKNGLTATQILNGAAAAAVKLAKSTGSQLGPAADVATDIMMQFGKNTGQLGEVIDQVNGVLIASKLDFDSYRLAIGQAGGVAGAAGITFEDFNAAIASTAALFASGSDAGTSFKTFLTRLNPQSKEAASMIKQLGLEFYDAQGRMKSMGAIAEELRMKMAGLSQEDRNRAMTVIFGTDAMRTAIGLMNQGAAGLENYRKQVAEVSADDQMAARTAGFSGALLKLKASLQELAIAIADSGLLEWLTGAVAQLAELVKWVRANVGEWGAFGTVVAAIAAALGPVVVAIGLLARTFGGLATVVRVAVIPVLWLFMRHPVILGGVILGAAIGLLIDNFKTLVGWIQDACDWLGRMTTLALNPALGLALEQKRAQVQKFWMGIAADAKAAADKAVAKAAEAAASRSAVAGAVAGAIKNLPFMATPKPGEPPAPVDRPNGFIDGSGGGGGGGKRAKQLAKDLEAAQKSVAKLATSIGRELRPELGGLKEKLQAVDDKFEDMRTQVQNQITELEDLAAQGVDTSAGLAQLKQILSDLEAGHKAATAAATAQFEAENKLANLDAQRTMQRQSQDIRDLKQARGDNGPMSESMARLQKADDELNDRRMEALARLGDMQLRQDEARRQGDTGQVERLTGIIALQQEYYGLLTATTAQQLEDQARIQDAWSTFEDDLSSTLTDAVMDWKLSLSDIGQIFANLARDLWVKPFMEGLSGQISGLFSGGGGGDPFAGFFADGGTIPPGSWGMVGEVGMERARWTPKGIEVDPVPGGGRQGTTVNQYISTPDLPTFRRTSRQTAREARSQFSER